MSTKGTRSAAGFALLETVVALAVVGTLVGLTSHALARVWRDVASIDLARILGSMEIYMRDTASDQGILAASIARSADPGVRRCFSPTAGSSCRHGEELPLPLVFPGSDSQAITGTVAEPAFYSAAGEMCKPGGDVKCRKISATSRLRIVCPKSCAGGFHGAVMVTLKFGQITREFVVEPAREQGGLPVALTVRCPTGMFLVGIGYDETGLCRDGRTIMPENQSAVTLRPIDCRVPRQSGQPRVQGFIRRIAPNGTLECGQQEWPKIARAH